MKAIKTGAVKTLDGQLYDKYDVVNAYKTKDGKLFEKEEQAIQHEIKIKLTEVIEDKFYYGDTADPREVVEAVLKNFNLTEKQ